MALLRTIENPQPNDIGDSAEEFLQFLGEPTCLIFSGQDSSRTRAIVTLLHGNEPSGAMAIFRWIKSGKQPLVNIVCIIASISTALYPPLFHYRTLPGSRDLNRCFQTPFEEDTGELAESILDTLACYQPEAVIDLHNTSSSGPAFGVCTYQSEQHNNITALFAHTLMVSEIKLGALMAHSSNGMPIVTIEVGGRLDKQAHDKAWEGIQRFFCQEQILTSDEGKRVHIYEEPVRIQLKSGVSLSYATTPNKEFDITLIENISQLSFQPITTEQHLGWVNRGGLDNFIIKDNVNHSAAEEWLTIKNNKLYPSSKSTLFMITNNPVIGIEDCLCYAVKASVAIH